MGATNQTPILGLPQFVGSDKPSWLGDFNGAMTLIDTHAGKIDGDVSSQDTKIATVQSSLTTVESSISSLESSLDSQAGQIQTINNSLTTIDSTISDIQNQLNNPLVQLKAVGTTMRVGNTAWQVGSNCSYLVSGNNLILFIPPQVLNYNSTNPIGSKFYTSQINGGGQWWNAVLSFRVIPELPLPNIDSSSITLPSPQLIYIPRQNFYLPYLYVDNNTVNFGCTPIGLIKINNYIYLGLVNAPTPASMYLLGGTVTINTYTGLESNNYYLQSIPN